MKCNPNPVQLDVTTHLEDLSSKLNDIISDSFEELAKKIGDCIFDNEIPLISIDGEESDRYIKLMDQYLKHIDSIIMNSYRDNVKQFDLAMNEYKNQIITVLNNKIYL